MATAVNQLANRLTGFAGSVKVVIALPDGSLAHVADSREDMEHNFLVLHPSPPIKGIRLDMEQLNKIAWKIAADTLHAIDVEAAQVSGGVLDHFQCKNKYILEEVIKKLEESV